jgi:SAM-dependent methyltransferase
VSLPPSYFDRLYAESDDPWGFRTRPYEDRKRSLTLASLLRPRYGRVFEPGCSIGTLTALLAPRAEHLVAMDPAGDALAQAATAVPDNVQLVQGTVPADWPDGELDLVVLSEVGYYLDGTAAAELAARSMASAEVVAVHWRHPVADYPLRGDEVHRLLAEAAGDGGLTRLVAHCEEDFLLDVWSRDPRSVATRGGLVG